MSDEYKSVERRTAIKSEERRTVKVKRRFKKRGNTICRKPNVSNRLIKICQIVLKRNKTTVAENEYKIRYFSRKMSSGGCSVVTAIL